MAPPPFLTLMAKPATAANRNPMIAFHPFVSASGAQEFFQIHMGGPAFLFLGEENIRLHKFTPHSLVLHGIFCT